MKEILIPVLWFALLGGVLGLLLAVASRLFAVKVDERVPKIVECLPGANCGGCGYTGCSAYAEAVVKGEAGVSCCTVGGGETAAAISGIMGVEAPVGVIRLRAQVMCSGTSEFSKKKYVYEGLPDCNAAARIGGGDKLCPNGCIGLGSCVAACPCGAIKVVDGVAVVDYLLCIGCGVCTTACPKKLIRLIPFDSRHWVGCMSVDKGATVRSYCDVGCIGCKLCERACESGAIKVENMHATIDYDKCTACDHCVEKCPRKIIWSAETQGEWGLAITREYLAKDSEK